jgi:hypothetical protein
MGISSFRAERRPCNFLLVAHLRTLLMSGQMESIRTCKLHRLNNSISLQLHEEILRYSVLFQYKIFCYMKWAYSTHGEKNTYNVSVGKPERKRTLGRHRHRWESNVKMGLREIRWGSMDWIDLVQDRDQWRSPVNTAINLRVSKMLENSWVA